jgi:hypothetical protein
MNRTQKLTADWLIEAGLHGCHLLTEALLRRGFLAFHDEQGVFLGSGSHEADLTVLKLVKGIDVCPIDNVSDRVASINFLDSDQIGAAIRIIQLGENHSERPHSGGFTSFGLGPYVNSSWTTYKRMKWGAKLAVCPAQSADQEQVSNSLDIGIALLIKSLPLARVATSLSCDGHSVRHASISFHFPWDVHWAKSVLNAIGTAHPNSSWTWGESELRISPLSGFHDQAMLGMLHDIQRVSRGLLVNEEIQKIANAREALMCSLQHLDRVSTEWFVTCAERHLHNEYSQH